LIVLDASVVVAYFNAAERTHDLVGSWLETVEEQLVTTPVGLAELDCVLARRAGASALEALWSDLEDGVYQVHWWADALPATVRTAREAPIEIGLADASLVALADEVGTTRIATLDETHFRRLRPRRAPAFVLLPADAAGGAHEGD